MVAVVSLLVVLVIVVSLLGVYRLTDMSNGEYGENSSWDFTGRISDSGLTFCGKGGGSDLSAESTGVSCPHNSGKVCDVSPL